MIATHNYVINYHRHVQSGATFDTSSNEYIQLLYSSTHCTISVSYSEWCLMWWSDLVEDERRNLYKNVRMLKLRTQI